MSTNFVSSLHDISAYLRLEGILPSDSEIKVILPKNCLFKLISNFEIKNKLHTESLIDEQNKIVGLSMYTPGNIKWFFCEDQ